jgi:hypothetical protein
LPASASSRPEQNQRYKTVISNGPWVPRPCQLAPGPRGERPFPAGGPDGAVRGLRQRAVTTSGDRLRAVYDRCLQRPPADDEDHPLDVDVDVNAAEQVIADLAPERAG